MSNFFKTNEGSVDRIVRVVVGLGLLGMAVAGPASPWGYIGIVPLATGLAGTCPVYSLFGLSTCPIPKSSPR